jgi:isochorismate synthase
VSATAPRPTDAADLADSPPPDPSDFVATSTPVGTSAWPPGMVAESADAGVLVAGRERLLASTGVAATLPLPNGLEDEEALFAVRAWLDAVEHPAVDEAQPAQGAMALGAFAFDRGAPAALVVPSTVWCRDKDGRTWRVDVRPRGAADPGRDVAPPTAPLSEGVRSSMSGRPLVAPDRASIRQVPAPAAYADAVARAVADIRAGELRKVVLARMVEVHLPATVLASQVLAALWGDDPVFSPFSVPTPDGRLVGASPELVIGRRGRTVTSHAFAGTVPLSESDGDGDEARLFESEKDRAEHRLAVEEIVSTLERRCVALTVPAEPTVVRLRSDARLGTLIRGTLTAAPADGDTALAFLSLLHPTPAVGGVPRAAALERIAALESAPRGYWAGAAGWTDGNGDGEWVLSIRSVELGSERALVRAGAGIVEGSEPQAELAETTFKLRPVLEALWAGASTLL